MSRRAAVVSSAARVCLRWRQGAGTGPAYRVVLLGRAAELGAVGRFLVPGAAGRVLVVCGEPGIGKSTVWEAGVGLARSRGFAAWCARPGQAEAQLSFAGLADLVEGAGRRPGGVQRRAHRAGDGLRRQRPVLHGMLMVSASGTAVKLG